MPKKTGSPSPDKLKFSVCINNDKFIYATCPGE